MGDWHTNIFLHLLSAQSNITFIGYWIYIMLIPVWNYSQYAGFVIRRFSITMEGFEKNFMHKTLQQLLEMEFFASDDLCRDYHKNWIVFSKTMVIIQPFLILMVQKQTPN